MRFSWFHYETITRPFSWSFVNGLPLRVSIFLIDEYIGIQFFYFFVRYRGNRLKTKITFPKVNHYFGAIVKRSGYEYMDIAFANCSV